VIISSSDTDNFLPYKLRGPYPELVIDVVLSHGDEATHPTKSNILVDQKVLAANDVEDVGTASAETFVLGPIGDNEHGKPKPSIADRVPIVSPSGRSGRNLLRIAVKQSDPVPQAGQVMTQVELPPNREPHSPLNLVAVEIDFGLVFEEFHQMS
jgi:hypothetical protein